MTKPEPFAKMRVLLPTCGLAASAVALSQFFHTAGVIMPINFKRDDEAGLAHDIVRRWEIDGHEVAVIKQGRLDDPESKRTEILVCECDYDEAEEREEAEDDQHPHRNDPEACAAKLGVLSQVKTESAVAARVELSLHGLDEAVLHVHRAIAAGKYLGQAQDGIIYLQEVAELLGKPLTDLRDAARRLYAQEKLDLNGMILTDYEQHFRFPEEMRMMIRMMVETPLGWPNGDAGGCAIEAIERAVTEGTDYKRGKDLFWEHNFPNIAPNHLLEFGMHFLATAIGRGEQEPTARDNLRYTDCERVAEWLEQTAARFRALGKANGFPATFTPDDSVGAVELLDEAAKAEPEEDKK